MHFLTKIFINKGFYRCINLNWTKLHENDNCLICSCTVFHMIHGLNWGIQGGLYILIYKHILKLDTIHQLRDGIA